MILHGLPLKIKGGKKMTKRQRWSSFLTMFLFVISIMFNFTCTEVTAKQKTPIIPKIQFVTAPATEYTAGDRVKFDIYCPNYNGKVEYRVILWDGNKKVANDLWNTQNGFPTRYYTKWQPNGKTVFNLGWQIFEPGAYRITVYAKRVGVPNSKAYLKRMNCDSYMESAAFVVKPKAQSTGILDVEGKVYGSLDDKNPEVIKNDVKITANKVTVNNANVEGDMYITGNNSTVKNAIVKGKIVIDPGKDGNALLENVSSKSVEILSGGKEGIHLSGVSADDLSINTENPVVVELSNKSKLTSTTAKGSVIFDKKDGSFGEIRTQGGEKQATIVELRGDIQEKVTVEAEANITASQEAKVKSLIIAATGKVTLSGLFENIDVNKEAKIVFATGADVKNVKLTASGEIKVEKGARIGVLDVNWMNIKIDNQGTIDKIINMPTSSTSSTSSTSPISPTPPIQINVTGIKLNIQSLVLGKACSEKLSANVSPSNATNTQVEWISSNTGIVSVDNTGKVTAINTGDAIVTVKTKDGSFTDKVAVKVIDGKLTERIERTEGKVKITVISEKADDMISIKLMDQQGNSKYNNQIRCTNGIVEIDIDLNAGVYDLYINSLCTDVIHIQI